MVLESAEGLITLLEEPNDQLKCFGLQKLNDVVNSHWFEIADSIATIERFFEDKKFPERKLAALLASKVYFHLGEYEDSLMLALGAENLFYEDPYSLFVDTIIGKGIDFYTKQKNQQALPKSSVVIDPRLEAMVNRIFTRCLEQKQYKQAVGIALETRRMDIVVKAAEESESEATEILGYTQKTALDFIQNRHYRNQVLKCLISLYSKLPEPDVVNMCQCLIFLDDPDSVAGVLDGLSRRDDNGKVIAYQIAFDLYESGTQQFLKKVISSLQALGRGETLESEVSEKMDVSASEDVAETKEEPSETVEEPAETANDPKLVKILSGDETIRLHMQFLIKNNHTDMLILKNIKEAVRNSVSHTGTVIANGFMHVSTTCDDFLRNNLDWVSKATNWSKFSAVASLGIIHKGHEMDAMKLLKDYLPKDTSGNSAGYMEGGALYALGLMHANHGNDQIITFLKNQLSTATVDTIRSGACLGLGLAAMATHRMDVYDSLKHQLYQDDAVTGESAGLAMGLVMLGSHSPTALEDMIRYAQDTAHEKILRGLAVGLGLLLYGRLEESEAIVESLLRDKEPQLRRAGVYALALAFCGTGKSDAVRKLLRLAVSDVNDDVRRAAVTSLGFLLYKTPEQCPALVSLLAESFNPHVRYGAAMALGISCAGTGSKEAIALLEPMLKDAVNFVRQGAQVASALVMIQQNEHGCPKAKEFRETLLKTVQDKHEDTIAKFGAIISLGIINAGGRNVTVSLESRRGHTDLGSVVGMLVFLQHWYWFPMTHFLSLAFTPTSLIGLNKDLQMPKLEFQCNAKASIFAYPPMMEEKKEKQADKVETAVLSITAKKKQKDRNRADDKMDVDEPSSDDKSSIGKDKKSEEISSDKTNQAKEAEKKDEKEKEAPKAPEPSTHSLENPARVLKNQRKFMVMPENSRYEPLRSISSGGIIMMRDKKSDEPVELVEPVKTGGGDKSTDENEQEPEPPEPFEYLGE